MRVWKGQILFHRQPFPALTLPLSSVFLSFCLGLNSARKREASVRAASLSSIPFPPLNISPNRGHRVGTEDGVRNGGL